MLDYAERSQLVFKGLGIETLSHAGNGRYNQSAELQPGVVYWAASHDNTRTDSFGLQFTGEGHDVFRLLEPEFKARGFDVRISRGMSHITVLKSVPRLSENAVDKGALLTVKQELDAILTMPRDFVVRKQTMASFVEFMRQSPLAGVDLAISARHVDQEREVF